MSTTSPSHPRRSRARPRRTRTGDRRRPATPKRSAAMSHASRLVVTASRVTTLQLAQMDTAAKPAAAPFRQFELAGRITGPDPYPERLDGLRERPDQSASTQKARGARPPYGGAAHIIPNDVPPTLLGTAEPGTRRNPIRS